MSFHEKSAWACLVSLLIAFVPYFFYVFQYPAAFVGLFIVAVVVLVALLVGFHVLNSVMSPSIHQTGDTSVRDERDIQIETWAAKVAGVVLGFLVMIWCLNAMYGIPVVAAVEASRNSSPEGGQTLSDFSIPALQALTWVHLMFAAFVAANLTYYLMIVLAYRSSA